MVNIMKSKEQVQEFYLQYLNCLIKIAFKRLALQAISRGSSDNITVNPGAVFCMSTIFSLKYFYLDKIIIIL